MPDKIQWVYSSKNNSELSDRYNQWAKDYEQDLTETFGRPNREPIVDLTIKYVPKNARILDAGVGTGIMGKWLHEEGVGCWVVKLPVDTDKQSRKRWFVGYTSKRP
ncbi:hypothetical protein [Limnofasciculus baicalensis]|nr:hypothetical protein [Limnofasciculus baicalensis]